MFQKWFKKPGFLSQKREDGYFLMNRNRYQNTYAKIQKIAKRAFEAISLLSALDLKLTHYSDRIKGSIIKVQQVAQSVAGMSQQTTASMTDISNAAANSADTLQNMSERANNIHENTVANTNMVQQITERNHEVITTSNDMERNVEELITKLNLIKDTVRGIENIAMQTNLLALNASIEAARAGEAGKGFSVVAERIRKLSSDTKELLTSTNKLIEEVEKASVSSSESVDKTVSLIKDVNRDLVTVNDRLLQNTKDVSELSGSLSEIAAFNQELNASLQEIMAVSHTLSTETETALKTATDLDVIMEGLSDMSSTMSEAEGILDSISKESGELVSTEEWKLPNQDFINTLNQAIESHKNWVTDLKQMVDNKEIIPLQTDDHKCAFGHFYYSVHPQNPEIDDLWKKVESIHSALHQSAIDVMESIKDNNELGAKQGYDRAYKLSQEIIGIFNQIIDKSQELDEESRSVFVTDVTPSPDPAL